jgi:type I restriction enzyme S subunit
LNTTPLKHAVEINRRTLAEDCPPDFEFRYLDISTVGTGQLLAEPQKLRFKHAPSRARRLVKEGDTIVSTVRTYLRAVLPITRDTADVVVSTGFAVLSPRAIEARYLGWLAQSSVFVDEVVARSVGVSYPAINPGDLGRIHIPLPRPAEQQAIADYLDAETNRIDDLVSARMRQAGLAGERLAASTDAVVLGLDLPGYAPKSAFFGHAPIGWTETALRHLGCEVQTGPFGSQLHADEYVDDGWPVVNPMNLAGGRIAATPGMSVSNHKRQELSRHVLRTGDIVFGRRGELGRAGLVEAEHTGWLCGTGSLRLRLTRDVLIPSFLKLLLETSALRSYFQLQSVGSTMDNLNAEIVLAMPCLVPPMDQQLSIVDQVHTTRDQLDRLVARADRQVALLQERKQALITAAVSGQLDIAREIAEEAS